MVESSALVRSVAEAMIRIRDETRRIYSTCILSI